MGLIVSPSILSGDFSKMGEEVKKIEAAGADWVHCDVMDGLFVDNLTFGHKMVADIHKCTKLPLDVHLMIDRPERYLKNYIDAGAGYLSFHVEATEKATENIEFIRSRGVNPGIAVRPDTKIEDIEKYLDMVSHVVVMGVNPGFGGQGYIPETTGRIRKLRGMISRRGLNVLISMDGGLSEQNAKELFSAGLDVGVSGSAFFASSDPAAYVKLLHTV